MVLLAGFVCKNKSKNNNQRGKYKNSIVNDEGETAETLKYLLQYVQKKQPAVLILENVDEFLKPSQIDELQAISVWLPCSQHAQLLC